MEKEISSGTMLGIVLIALAAVIGLGFGVFSIAKGVANEGTVGVQDNLNTVTDSAFEDYNDKVVTGTQVKSAIQNFEGKSVAILINTTAMNKGVTTYAQHDKGCTTVTIGGVPYVNYNALLALNSDGNNAIAAIKAGNAIMIKDNGGNLKLSEEKGTPVSPANASEITCITALKDGENADAKLKDGALTIAHAFAIDDTGKVMTDTGIGGLSRTGNSEYVAASSKFTANLVKDTSGTNVGIMFTQMAK